MTLGYYNPKTGVGINVLNPFEVEKVLLSNHKKGYLNIASFHAGLEHVNYPSYDHIEMARTFAKKVPYIYYGHHPHVIQGIENVNGSIIAYSLGNFCFDDVYTTKSEEPLIKQSEENKRSFIFSLIIKKNTLKHEEIPIYADKSKITVGTKLNILNDLDCYSKFLDLEKVAYIDYRNRLIKKKLCKRKAKRDLKWYFKRLNIESIGIIINYIINRKKYEQMIINYIN